MFPQLLVSPSETHLLKDKDFYPNIKLLSDQYVNAISFLNNQR